jgi:hypothetical protein
MFRGTARSKLRLATRNSRTGDGPASRARARKNDPTRQNRASNHGRGRARAVPPGSHLGGHLRRACASGRLLTIPLSSQGLHIGLIHNLVALAHLCAPLQSARAQLGDRLARWSDTGPGQPLIAVASGAAWHPAAAGPADALRFTTQAAQPAPPTDLLTGLRAALTDAPLDLPALEAVLVAFAPCPIRLAPLSTAARGRFHPPAAARPPPQPPPRARSHQHPRRHPARSRTHPLGPRARRRPPPPPPPPPWRPLLRAGHAAWGESGSRP